MRIYVLIPVFNRLQHTERVVECLSRQTLRDSVQIVVIDDGSTDGTAEYLRSCADVMVVQGDGNLWWTGAIDRGLRTVLPDCGDDDYVMFLNNDTWFAPDYVETLVACSVAHSGAAVGSVIHEEDRDPPLVSIGARVNINRLAVWDRLSELQETEARNPREIYKVDALSGRGTLYSARLFKTHGGVRTLLLPHYMADYEISMRFARHGTPLIVSSRAIVFSPPVYGNESSNKSFWQRFFGKRSAHNLLQRLIFYSLVGTIPQRLTALPRMIYFDLVGGISRWTEQ